MKPRSSSISSPQMARLLGWSLLAFIIYAMTSAAIFLASLLLLQKEIIPDLPWIDAVQERLYFSGARNIWQAQPDCVAFDKDLIYKPKNGACRFDNVEFKTMMNFSPEGRYTGAKPKGMGIAVLGDSHATGWGVGDEETFSAELQRLNGRPVYNLAVSSYGTVRELIRMEKSGLLDKFDTIVIQYSDNDLEENMGSRPGSLLAAKKKFKTLTPAHNASFFNQFKFLNEGYWFTFTVPFSSLKKRLLPKKAEDFLRHYQPLITVLSRHGALKSKRIIVFYSNSHGGKFLSFPVGKDRQLPNVDFVDLNLDRDDYYRIDDHLTSAGHKKAAQHLSTLIRQQKS
jgi:hypothetical protein